jgi:hypothetical protein
MGTDRGRPTAYFVRHGLDILRSATLFSPRRSATVAAHNVRRGWVELVLYCLQQRFVDPLSMAN